MTNDWRENLKAILKERNISMRKLSMEINRSEHYVKMLLKSDSTPGIEVAFEICRALDLPLTFFVDGSADETEVATFARQFASLSPAEKDAVKAVIRTFSNETDKS